MNTPQNSCIFSGYIVKIQNRKQQKFICSSNQNQEIYLQSKSQGQGDQWIINLYNKNPKNKENQNGMVIYNQDIVFFQHVSTQKYLGMQRVEQIIKSKLVINLQQIPTFFVISLIDNPYSIIPLTIGQPLKIEFVRYELCLGLDGSNLSQVESFKSNNDAFIISEQLALQQEIPFERQLLRQQESEINLRDSDIITLRHVNTGCYLRSSKIFLQSGSQQQEVTCSESYDDYNKWRVTVHLFASADRKEPQSVVRNGDLIILTHLHSNKNLHSHNNHKSSNTQQQEVTCFGELGMGDHNDHWQVQFITKNELFWSKNIVVTLQHVHTKTKLHSHKRYVGENIRMQEVTCFKDSDSNDFWVLEEIDSIYI